MKNMFLCRSKNHVWKSREDAAKCCNGYKRVLVTGKEIPPGTPNIIVNKQTGIKYSRIWVKE